MRLRDCNLLWFKDVNALTNDDLKLLEHAFERGFIPLGDGFGDKGGRWDVWRTEVELKIKEMRD